MWWWAFLLPRTILNRRIGMCREAGAAAGFLQPAGQSLRMTDIAMRWTPVLRSSVSGQAEARPAEKMIPNMTSTAAA